MKEAWVLRLKDESKEADMSGEYYFNADDDEVGWVTDNLQKATIYPDKEREIDAMKSHERYMVARYGDDAIRNFGYTNMMKQFEFVEVELAEVD